MITLIGYDNHIDDPDTILTGGVWTMPLTSLRDPRPGRKARSSGLSLSNTQLRIELPETQDLRLICLTHTNLTAAGLYRLTLYSDEFTTVVLQTSWQTVPGYPPYDPDFLGASIFHVLDETVSSAHILVEFDDQTNPAGFVEIGRALAPRVWQPIYSFEQSSNSDSLRPNTTRQNALGGYGYFNRRTPARQLRAIWPVLPPDELPVVRRLRRVSGINRQVVVVPDTRDVDNYHERCFLATISELPAIALHAVGGAIGFEFTEVVP